MTVPLSEKFNVLHSLVINKYLLMSKFCIKYIPRIGGNLKTANGLSTTTTNNVQCTICGKQFASPHSLKQHMQFHTGQYSYYCDPCRRGFINKSHFTAHMRIHKGLKYYCEYCSKPFVNKQTYQYHLSSHTGNYRFKCTACGEGFNNKSSYESHRVTHM